MKVLIACEYSGIVRDAFTALGHDATSCDLLASETPGNHYQGNVLDIINNEFDLLIGHPPCTFLSYACTALWNDPERTVKRIEAAAFFMQLYNAPIKYICIENPQGIMTKLFRPPDQTIQPYYFGEDKMKRTCFWLKNLPPLKYQLEVDLFNEKITAAKHPEPLQIQIRKKTGQIKKRYSSDAINHENFKNGHLRSRFFPAVAKAMAEQWNEYILEK